MCVKSITDQELYHRFDARRWMRGGRQISCCTCCCQGSVSFYFWLFSSSFTSFSLVCCHNLLGIQCCYIEDCCAGRYTIDVQKDSLAQPLFRLIVCLFISEMKGKTKTNENKTCLPPPSFRGIVSFRDGEKHYFTNAKLSRSAIILFDCLVLEMTKKLQHAKAKQSRSGFILWRWHVSHNGCRLFLRRIARVMSSGGSNTEALQGARLADRVQP